MKAYSSIAAFLLAAPSVLCAETCLTIENVKGQSAYSPVYRMSDDGFSGTHSFCYEDDQGRFNDNQGAFMRSGADTWIFVSAEKLGDAVVAELVEVWTFDLSARKALLSRTRVSSLLPSTVGVFVGDITAMETR